MVDSYWRKLDDDINNLKNAIQISAILLKLKEHDKKLNDNSKIESNLEKIDTNITDISFNKTKIKQNEKDIVSILKNKFIIIKFILDSIEIKNNNTGLIKIMNIPINYSFSNDNYTIEINASYKYSSSYKHKNFNNIYQFYNNNSLFKYKSINHKDSYNGNLIINNFEIELGNFTNIRLDIHLESILSNTENLNLYKDDNSFIEIKCYKYADVFQIKKMKKILNLI